METESQREQPPPLRQSLSVPVAIVIAGVIIAGAVYLSDRGGNSAVLSDPKDGSESADEIENMNPITGADHIRGNPNARVKIVEYSDFECPFCKRFHPTMQKVMDEYGKGGEVACVYRHFSLDSLHPVKARA